MRGESRFCRAHGVWEKGMRHRGGSIRASIEGARVGTVVCGSEVEGPLQARDVIAAWVHLELRW